MKIHIGLGVTYRGPLFGLILGKYKARQQMVCLVRVPRTSMPDDRASDHASTYLVCLSFWHTAKWHQGLTMSASVGRPSRHAPTDNRYGTQTRYRSHRTALPRTNMVLDAFAIVCFRLPCPHFGRSRDTSVLFLNSITISDVPRKNNTAIWDFPPSLLSNKFQSTA